MSVTSDPPPAAVTSAAPPKQRAPSDPPLADVLPERLFPDDRWRDLRYRVRNRLMRWAYDEHLGPVWDLVQAVRPVERRVNRALVDQGVGTVPARPYPYSTKHDHTSWDSLTDRTYNARELLPVAVRRTEPPAEQVLELFRREAFIESPKSTVLLSYVAQWFTDGFLRSDRSVTGATRRDIRRNESSHEVDMAQVYGLTPAVTEMLRDQHDRALLATQVIDGEEYPPDLYDAAGERVPQFEDLRVIGADDPGVDRSQLLAMGSDTSNTQIGYAMINVLFLREHNRVAREIRACEPTWSDDRVFDAARSVLNVVLVKVLIEDYIHHISPYRFRFRFDPQGFERSRWHRPNFVAVEFNLLYRWHSMIPPTFRIGGEDVGLAETTMYRTRALLTGRGLGGLFEDASSQACGQVGLFNTGSPLLERAELATIKEARDVRVRGVNDYLTRYQFPRAQRFEDFSSDPRVFEGLRRTYRDPDDVELYVGLFAGDVPSHSILAPLMERMLAIHAFSQLMTHPLLAPAVYTAETFSRRGLEMIEQTSSIAQVVRRNVPAGKADGYVSLTRQGWRER